MASNVAVIQYADDGTGTLLDPIPSALVAPGATNDHVYSEDFSNAYWVKDNVSVTLYGTGIFNGGPETLLEALSGTYWRIHHGAYPPENCWLWNIVKQATSDTFGIGMDGNTVCTYRFSTDTFFGLGSNVIETYSKELGDGWWIVGMKGANFTWTPCAIRFDAEDQDVYICHSELSQAAPRFPIYTAGATVVRDKDEIILDNLNLNATEGSLYFELIAGQDTANLLDGFLTMTSGVVEADDGTNQASSAEVVAVDVASKVGMIWGPDGMQQCTDGVWSSLESYDGSLNDGVLDLFRDATASNQIRELQIWDAVQTSTIDGLMDG